VASARRALAARIQVAGMSYRAGFISVTVEKETPTSVSLGWFNSLQDSFVISCTPTTTNPPEGPCINAGGDLYTDDPGAVHFGTATINAPEPAASLAMLAGVASVALLARQSARRRSR